MRATIRRALELRELEVLEYRGRAVVLRWPLVGAVAFSLVDGAGPGGWRLEPESAAELRADEGAHFAARRGGRVARAHHRALWNDNATPAQKAGRK